jgi:hypothetical protein
MWEPMIGFGETLSNSTYLLGSLADLQVLFLYSNHVGNYRWTTALQWSGHKAFNKEELREWKVGGDVAGYTRGAGGLTFATVLGAGHMVCCPLCRNHLLTSRFLRFPMISPSRLWSSSTVGLLAMIFERLPKHR